MGIPRKIFLAAGIILALSACGNQKAQKLDDVLPPSGVGPKIRGRNGGTAVIPGGNVGPQPIKVTPRKDISWTDSDNPDAGIPELENLMAAPKKGPWEESETIARQIAALEGKPILIWFTDSARSPMCKVLSKELFGTPEFGKWAKQHLVRLRVNSNISVDDSDLSLDEKITRQSELKTYVKRLKKRYKILGTPSVLMLNPSGEVIARYRGYKRGEADYYWGLIKQGEASSSHAYKSWRQGLESKGYREWKGHRGKKVFAKLVNYSKGSLVLIEPGGSRYKTTEAKLSSKDKKWIAEQKAMRGIQ